MDKKAKKILFDTYWKNGWKNNIEINPNDFAYAKAKGLMFDPFNINHDDCIQQIILIRDKIAKEQVAKAFLSSLSTRRLEWRSIINSYHLAQQIPLHQFDAHVAGQSYENGKITHTSYTCGICKNLRYGISGDQTYDHVDLNVLNFERIKWGGVRHGNILYMLFDLLQFQKDEITSPTEQDKIIFKNILAQINSCEKGDFPGVLRDKLKDIDGFKSNANERSTLVELLACIDILKPASYDRPNSSKHDWVYAEFWRGEDGFNVHAVDYYFKHFL